MKNVKSLKELLSATTEYHTAMWLLPERLLKIFVNLLFRPKQFISGYCVVSYKELLQINEFVRDTTDHCNKLAFNHLSSFVICQMWFLSECHHWPHKILKNCHPA